LEKENNGVPTINYPTSAPIELGLGISLTEDFEPCGQKMHISSENAFKLHGESWQQTTLRKSLLGWAEFAEL